MKKIVIFSINYKDKKSKMPKFPRTRLPPPERDGKLKRDYYVEIWVKYPNKTTYKKAVKQVFKHRSWKLYQR